MKLEFSKNFPDDKNIIGGGYTRFTEAIWRSLVFYDLVTYNKFDTWTDLLLVSNKIDMHYLDEKYGDNDAGKIHTIRRDVKNKWRAGRNIHFTMQDTNGDLYQFAPVVKCTVKQRFEIRYIHDNEDHPEEGGVCEVYIDGRELKVNEIEELAINDGFNSATEFLSYFDGPYIGYIIHWTPYKYPTDPDEVIYNHRKIKELK